MGVEGPALSLALSAVEGAAEGNSRNFSNHCPNTRHANQATMATTPSSTNSAYWRT